VTKFVDVILPLPFNRNFTYVLSPDDEDKVKRGSRVVVPLGKTKSYTAIVADVHENKPEAYRVKQVTAVLDDEPILLPFQLKFWKWIADYYLCNVGDVYKAALPSGLKVESETLVELNDNYPESSSLSEEEKNILQIVGENTCVPISVLQEKSGDKNLLPLIKSLIEKSALLVTEKLHDHYHPKTEARVRFKDAMDEERLKKLFIIFDKKPKQMALLMKYVELSGILGKGDVKPVSKSRLLQETGVTASVLKTLSEKNIFETYYEEIGRLDTSSDEVSASHELNEYQAEAYRQIQESFQTKEVCLLHGVTSSGKTEVYIHLIEDALQKNKQVLYLLPEIALTTQITHRLKKVFGSRLGIYHSKFSDAERVEIWKKQISDHPYDIILGVRSSVFLPFSRLGLVIVDEEHETTYKQQDPAPRYHARSAAIVLAAMCQAKTLLGTATPSIESWYNAQNGKYAYVSLEHRYQDIQLPQIEPVDMRQARKRKQMDGLFSGELISKIKEALERHEQVILFKNRRGFSPMIMCHTCGWVPRCINCDVSLTYHRNMNQLTCHYCGYTVKVPDVCPACESTELTRMGFGTERIEDDVNALFPQARIARMDLDTTRSRMAYERIISDFECGNIDILIGTQIISKGLDFDKVSIVGILDADSLLNYPDFRSYERSFQLMAQVAGRSGRKGKQGLVVLQTRDVKQPIITQIMNHDFKGMVEVQLSERKQFHYPPFCHLVYVYMKHKDEKNVHLLAETLALRLRKIFGSRVVGPDQPPVGRIQSFYIRRIVLKIGQTDSFSSAREILQRVQGEVSGSKLFKGSIVYFDVDPI
jgi:primosomal protein N' (replication factor Y)